MNTFALPAAIVDQVMQHARRDPQHEVCGLISYRIDDLEQRLFRLYRIDNVAADTRVQFDMHPAQLIDAMRQMRETQQQLIAIYHSHPQSAAHPSARDFAQHQYPQALCLIVSPHCDAHAQINAFRKQEDGFVSVTLEISA